MPLEGFNNNSLLLQDCEKDLSIDYDFFDSVYENETDVNENNNGVQKVQIKLNKKNESTNENIENLKECIEYESELKSNNRVKKRIAKYRSKENFIVEEEDTINNDSDNDDKNKNLKGNNFRNKLESPQRPISPNSDDLTNVTPASSSNSSNYSFNVTKNGDEYCSDFEEDPEISKNNMKLLSDAVESLNIHHRNDRRINSCNTQTNLSLSRCQSSTFPSNRQRRKNMSFTNEELRKIERENEILQKKIMACKKPRPKANSLFNKNSMVTPLRVKASAAINRSKKQQQINHDNYILIKKIHNVKPTQSIVDSRSSCDDNTIFGK